MKISVRLFSILRERAGASELSLELPAGATVADALAELAGREGLGDALSRTAVAAAVNREYAERTSALSEGDELALVPPVSGGAGPATTPAVHVRVTSEPLSLDAVTARAGRPGAGAVVTFQGTTRDVDSLDYEAYAEMAESKIAQILRDCVERHGLEAAAAEHRTGTVLLGEPSVIVAVSAAHRPEAFEGAREAIDRIKAEAPIWKVEVSGGERRPVEGTPAPGAERGG